MRIKKSKRAEIEAQHAQAAELRAQHEAWVRYCEDVKAGRVKRRRAPGGLSVLMVAAAMSLGGGVR